MNKLIPSIKVPIIQKGIVSKVILSDELKDKIAAYDGLIIRSATKVTKEIIENAKNLKIIGRAGAGVDNIDLVFAKEKKNYSYEYSWRQYQCNC